MSELVEKVAEAMFIGVMSKRYGDIPQMIPWWPPCKEIMAEYLELAMWALPAVLDALQEPSEGMRKTGEEQVTYAILDEQDPSSSEIWEAMIAKFREEQGL